MIIQASKNCLDVLREQGGSHYVLLSAICVQKPLLEFQRAKLKLEEDIASQNDVTWSIVRPTAFFKSLAGQVSLSFCLAPTWCVMSTGLLLVIMFGM
jgi:divinyl chlorophyllide a 8-vinyl-reductase